VSVIFGIFYRDGRPVSDELEKMFSGMRHFPHERHALVTRGNCAFGHMLTYNTPEAVGEAMPRWVDEAKLLFVSEGRLDNRDELFEGLGVPTDERAAMPDGDLMLRAYLKWGEKCVDHLMGKWSLAAFHTDDQRLFLARDKWDYTAVDYYVDDKVIAFGTSSKGLFPLPFIKKEIDEIMIARLLVIWPGDFDKTYFKGIKRLLPSHTLRVTRENTLLNRYWNYADIPVHYGLKLEDYCDDLFDKLNKAVAARLRSYKPIAGTLSGGLDSSTVCYLAAEQMAKQGKRLRTYTHVPLYPVSKTLSPNQFGDERPYVEEIVKASGNIDPEYLNSANISPLKGIEEAIRLCGEPFHGAGNAYWLVDIYTTAQREGYGTLLMGEFGNATTSWAGVEDALPAREIFRRYGIKGVVKKKMLKPLLYGKNPVGNLYKQYVFVKCPWEKYSLIDKEFAKVLGIAGKMKTSGNDIIFRRFSLNSKKTALLSLDFSTRRLTNQSHFGCETGIEVRDPTGDPSVIHAALSIPNEVYCGKMNKWVLRTMMSNKLPACVIFNRRIGLQSADIVGRLRKYSNVVDEMISGMRSANILHIVDIQRISNEWMKIEQGDINHEIFDVNCMMRAFSAYLFLGAHN
jgi:asparagine synthase (glutamine-hydrolysing)